MGMNLLLWAVWISGVCLAVEIAAMVAVVMVVMFSRDMSFCMFYAMGLFGYVSTAVMVTALFFVVAALLYGALKLSGF
jgi:hypothetical protein